MLRLYQDMLIGHIKTEQQMLFLAGPRQVGKTTISQAIEALGMDFSYLNWDVQEHQQLLVQGAQTVGAALQITRARATLPIVVFDEIHKYSQWKNYLKGFYDLYSQKIHIIVTGSARLDIYQAGGDSLMGRYFLYRIHPFSVAELANPHPAQYDIQPPQRISESSFQALWNFGGFPQPYIKQDKKFHLRWKKLRDQQIFQEDLRDLTHIHEISRMKLLAELLRLQVGQLINRNNLANKINVSVNTVSHWIEALSQLYYCFTITPWHKNVSRSLIKEPKLYLWDWSFLEDIGAKAENFVASHLLKAVHFWNDRGLGEYSLHFIRDKDKNEVDFLVIKNQQPWMLVEVKNSNNHRISQHLKKFHQQLQTKHAFQVIIDLPYESVDCFSYSEPVIVPAITWLSQLV
jgi:uncharacterized protein